MKKTVKKTEIPSYPVRRFFRTKLVGTYGLSPDGKEASVSTNFTGVPELWRISPSGGWPEQLTYDGQSIAQVEYSPDGKWIAFLQDEGGNERYGVCLLPREGGEKRRLTNSHSCRHLGLAWSPDSQSLYYAANRRNPKYFHLYRLDLATGHETEVLKNDEEGDAGVVGLTKDGKGLFWMLGQTNLRQRLHFLDLKTGADRDLSPGPECTIVSPHWVEKHKRVYFLTDLNSDTHGIGQVQLPGGEFSWKRKPGRAELQSFAASPDGSAFVWSENRDGYFDAFIEKKGRAKALKPGAKAAQRGVTGGFSFSHNGRSLGLVHAHPSAPHEIFSMSLASGKFTQLTRSGAGGIPAEHLATPKLVRYPSVDGTMISGFLYLPKRGAKPWPLLVWPHGGPESQETAEFRARHQFWANHGIAVFAPNFRGSTGFGRKFQRLIYKDWGGGHYQDIVAGVKHLIAQGVADPERVGIYGGSFGGYTTLWAITQDPGLWKAAVAVVAPSNLKTLIESTHASWRRWAMELIGDLEQDKDMLERRSPLSFADRVKTPLILFQGANDPRVPKAEADQFAEALKRHGIPCDYVVFENEGHGWRTLERVFEEMERSLAFLKKHLVEKAAPRAVLAGSNGHRETAPAAVP